MSLLDLPMLCIKEIAGRTGALTILRVSRGCFDTFAYHVYEAMDPGCPVSSSRFQCPVRHHARARYVKGRRAQELSTLMSAAAVTRYAMAVAHVDDSVLTRFVDADHRVDVRAVKRFLADNMDLVHERCDAFVRDGDVDPRGRSWHISWDTNTPTAPPPVSPSPDKRW